MKTTTEEPQQTSPYGLVQPASDTQQFINRIRTLAGMPEPIPLKVVYKLIKDKFRYYRSHHKSKPK